MNAQATCPGCGQIDDCSPILRISGGSESECIAAYVCTPCAIELLGGSNHGSLIRWFSMLDNIHRRPHLYFFRRGPRAQVLQQLDAMPARVYLPISAGIIGGHVSIKTICSDLHAELKRLQPAMDLAAIQNLQLEITNLTAKGESIQRVMENLPKRGSDNDTAGKYEKLYEERRGILNKINALQNQLNPLIAAKSKASGRIAEITSLLNADEAVSIATGRLKAIPSLIRKATDRCTSLSRIVEKIKGEIDEVERKLHEGRQEFALAGVIARLSGKNPSDDSGVMRLRFKNEDLQETLKYAMKEEAAAREDLQKIEGERSAAIMAYLQARTSQAHLRYLAAEADFIPACIEMSAANILNGRGFIPLFETSVPGDEVDNLVNRLRGEAEALLS